MTNKDCEELEKQLETLKFRNDVLHKANQKQQDEILDLRTKVKKLEHQKKVEEIDKAIKQVERDYRNEKIDLEELDEKIQEMELARLKVIAEL